MRIYINGQEFFTEDVAEQVNEAARRRDEIIKKCEDDAIAHFGEDVVGNDFVRRHLEPQKKKEVLDYLFSRFEFYQSHA